MWYIIAFLVLIIVGLLDGHTSSVVAMLLLYLLGFLSVNLRNNAADRSSGSKVFGKVFSVYVISVFIASRSFLNGQSFYVEDPIKYIDKYGIINTWSFSDALEVVTQTIFFFSDDNGLYNQGLSFWSYIANHYFDGTSVFYLSFFQTLFGVLTALEVYKIFAYYFLPSKACKYACLFTLLSLFHIYSIVIVRDIAIAYLYMIGLRIVIRKPKITDIFILLFVLAATVGIRLYTGLFFGAFIMFWLYKLLQDKKYAKFKFLLVPIIIVGVVFVGAAFASSVLIESTTNQMESLDAMYEGKSGVSSRLRGLPIGVRHIAILFFSQLPLDNLSRFSIASSLSNYYLAILAVVYEIFGFVIFYGLMYYCLFKGFFKKMAFNERWILIIMLIFIALTLSSHIDLRRSMEAVPFIFLLYMLVPETYNRAIWHKTNKNLIAIGVLMMIAYSMIF